MAATVRAYPRLGLGLAALSLLAWLLLLPALHGPATAGAGALLAPAWCGSVHSLPPALLAMRLRAGLPPALPQAWLAALGWAWAGSWGLMLVAMMLPTLGPPLYYLLLNSRARRRWQLVGVFLAGYGAVWLVAGAGLLALALAARQWGPGGYGLAGATALLALGWQVSPAKQRCLNRGHRHQPLAAFGWRAAGSAGRMGLVHGGWCVASCWAAMLLPLVLAEAHLGLMLAVSLLVWCERLDPPAQPAWRWRGFATALAYLRLRSGRPHQTPFTPADLTYG